MKRFFIETYGCQMNRAESSSLAAQLMAKGFIEVFSHEEADIILINTCSVRKTAENRIWGRLGFYKRQKREREIIVLIMGCMPQRIGKELTTEKYAADIVVGNFYKKRIPEILLAHQKGLREIYIDTLKTDTDLFFPFSSPEESNPAKAYVTISHGCNNFCTYCIVPYLRGREISRKSDLIIEDINRLTEHGVKQVMLLGQNVNSYGNDTKDVNFPNLLKRITKETEVEWIKFMSSHPKDLSDPLIEVMATEPKISKWLHLALQSGSDPILKMMNRNYSVASFLNKIEKLKRQIPDIILTTDILVGFPGETEENYQDTLQIIRHIKFTDAFMYKYNERDNTFAQKELGDPIPDEVKTERLKELIEIQRNIALENRKSMKGKRFHLLYERPANDGTGRHIGISSNELIFLYNGSEEDKGKIIEIEATGVNNSTLTGKKI